jgi:hypothetical protein
MNIRFNLEGLLIDIINEAERNERRVSHPHELFIRYKRPAILQ